MDRDEKLKLDYEQTIAYYHHLDDSRFKLLALVPIVTGTAVGLLSKDTQPNSVLAVAILGFVVTIGLFLYNQRNTQIFDTMVLRAKMLEILLQLEPLDDRYRFAGPFLSRPQRSLKLFGMIRVWSDRGLGIVYGAALGGWAFLITDSILRLAVASPTVSPLKVVIPVVIAYAFIWQVERWDKETEKLDVMPPKIQKLIEVDRSKERGSSSSRRSRKD